MSNTVFMAGVLLIIVAMKGRAEAAAYLDQEWAWIFMLGAIILDIFRANRFLFKR